MSEPTTAELESIGHSILGRSLEYDRGEVKLAQEIVCKEAEIQRLRDENKRLEVTVQCWRDAGAMLAKALPGSTEDNFQSLQNAFDAVAWKIPSGTDRRR